MVRHVVIIVLLFVCTVSPAFSAERPGFIEGVVRSQDGLPIAGARLVLTSTVRVRQMNAVSDVDGRYRFPGLPAGEYHLDVSAPLYRSGRYGALRLAQGQGMTLAVELFAETYSASVLIEARTPLIDSRGTEIGSALDADQLAKLPVPRFLSDLTALSPGNVGGDTFVSSTLGGSASANAYKVDGVDVSDPATGRMWVYPNLECIAEVEILPIAGATADVGGFTGASLNMITRSGGERFSGSLAWYWFTEDMTGWNTDDPSLRALVLRETFNDDFSASLGGPLLSGRAWFYGNIGVRNREQRFGDRAIPYRYRNTLWKFTGAPGDEMSLVLTGHFSHFYRNGRGAAYNVAPEATHEQQGPNRSFAIDYSWVPDDATVIGLRFHGWDGFFTLEGRGSGPRLYDADRDFFYGNAPGDYRTDRDRYNAVVTASRHFSNGSGRHHLSAGLEWLRGQQHTVQAFDTVEIAGGSYRYRTLYEPGFDARNRIAGITAHVMDSWQPADGLTLNLGLRSEKTDYHIPDQETATGAIIAGPGTIHTFGHWAPRLGIVWQPAGPETVIRASVGRYHESVLTYLLDEFTPGDARRREFTWDGASWIENFSAPLANPGSFSLDPELGALYADAVTLGIEQVLCGDMVLSADYLHREYRNFPVRIEDGLRWEPVSVEAGGTEYTLFSRAGGPAHFTFANREELFSDYDALILSAARRYDGRWQAHASLTLSRLYGNAESKTGASDGAIIGDLETFLDPNNRINDEGLLYAHRPWNFKFNGTWTFADDLNLSAILSWAPGPRWTPQVRIEDPRLVQGRVTIFAEPRGSRALDAAFILDVRLEKGFAIAGGRFSALVDIYNVSNDGTPDGVVTRRDQANFGAPVSLPGARRIQVGIRYEF